MSEQQRLQIAGIAKSRNLTPDAVEAVVGNAGAVLIDKVAADVRAARVDVGVVVVAVTWPVGLVGRNVSADLLGEAYANVPRNSPSRVISS